MKIDNSKEQYRINERIRVREVRLVGDKFIPHHRHLKSPKIKD